MRSFLTGPSQWQSESSRMVAMQLSVTGAHKTCCRVAPSRDVSRMQLWCSILGAHMWKTDPARVLILELGSGGTTYLGWGGVTML